MAQKYLLLFCAVLLPLIHANPAPYLPYTLSKFEEDIYTNFLAPLLPTADRYKSIDKIVRENGFRFEEHKVQTHDGYWLTLHRIRHRNKY